MIEKLKAIAHTMRTTADHYDPRILLRTVRGALAEVEQAERRYVELIDALGLVEHHEGSSKIPDHEEVIQFAREAGAAWVESAVQSDRYRAAALRLVSTRLHAELGQAERQRDRYRNILHAHLDQLQWAFEGAGCTTGDCPHGHVQDCATALGERLKEIADDAAELLEVTR